MKCYKNILIHHMFGGIGDFIMGTSAINLIRDFYPDCNITVIAPPVAAGVIQNNPAVNKIIIFDYKSKSSFLSKSNIDLCKQIWKEKYDLSISLDCKDRFALINWLARIPTRTGASKINHTKPSLTLASKLYTDYIDIPFDINAVHQTFTYQYFVKSFLGVDAKKYKPLSITPTNQDYCKGKSLIEALPQSKYKIAYCIKGKDDKKRAFDKDWSRESFINLINKIDKNYDALQFIVGAKSDYEYINTISEKAPIHNLAGQTTLHELGAILKSVDLLITVDTGVMHIAAGLDVPTIAIFKKSLPIKWAPCNQNAIVIHYEDLVKTPPKDLECSLIPSKELRVDELFELASRFLK